MGLIDFVKDAGADLLNRPEVPPGTTRLEVCGYARI